MNPTLTMPHKTVQSSKYWLTSELANLRKSYSDATEDELRTLFPKRSVNSIRKQASRLGLRRRRTIPLKGLHPIIAALVNARYEQKMSRRVLCTKVGYPENDVLRWETGISHPGLARVYDWAMALGFQLLLCPISEAEQTAAAKVGPPKRTEAAPSIFDLPHKKQHPVQVWRRMDLL